MKSIPKRSFKIEIEGKTFVVKELSAAYLKQASMDGTDTSLLAIEDAIEDFSEEDFKLFGVETENKLYKEIVNFTFLPKLSNEETRELAKEINLSEKELLTLDLDTRLALRTIIESRKPMDASENARRKKP